MRFSVKEYIEVRGYGLLYHIDKDIDPLSETCVCDDNLHYKHLDEQIIFPGYGQTLINPLNTNNIIKAY